MGTLESLSNKNPSRIPSRRRNSRRRVVGRVRNVHLVRHGLQHDDSGSVMEELLIMFGICSIPARLEEGEGIDAVLNDEDFGGVREAATSASIVDV
jgi:hypothetical protein